jgi:non-ribosomal peptide synthase protein (TIGR01720 family)
VNTDIYFNYLGEIDMGNKDGVGYSSGICVAEENMLPGTININGSIMRGELCFTVTYDRSKYADEIIERLAELYKSNLNEIVVYCINQDQTVRTVSDSFADDLDSNDLDIINLMF